MAIVGDAYIVVRAITTGFEDEVRRAAGNIKLDRDGKRVGQSFSDGFSDGIGRRLGRGFKNFRQEAEQARRTFQSLVRTSYTLTAALGPIVSGIGSLGGGLVTLVSAAGAAVPSLAVLLGVMTSLGLAAIVTAGAFSGVSNAISAGLKKSSAGAKSDAASKIAAARRIEAAQENLVEADERLTEAQEDLTKALKDGREELQQLGFDAEDAAINEKKAAIELEKARETLARVQDLPPNSRARREAQLAFAEAELNYRRSKDRNQDLQKQQSDLVDSSKNVSQELLDVAKATFPDIQDEGLLRLISATDTAQSAFKGVKDAAKAKAKAERDALRAVEEAKDAGSAGGVDAFADALKDLSPEAQKFVKFMVNEFIPALKELRDAAAAGLFPGLEEGLRRLKDELFPDIKSSVKDLAKSVATAFNSIVDAIVDVENKADLKKVFDTSGYVVEGFGKVFGNVYDSILSILVGADKQIRRFTDFLVKKTGEFAKFLDTKQESKELEEFFNKTGDITAKIGEIFGNTFSGLVNIIKANFTPGGGGYILLEYLKDVTAEFEKFSGSEEGQKKLSDYFKDTAENTKSILGLFGSLIKAILKSGADPNVGKFFDILKESIPTFEAILKEANAAGPSLAKFIGSILTFTKLTLESGAITAFFTTLRVALDFINKILENKIVQGILKVTGVVFAFLSALGLIGTIAKFAFMVVAGNIIRVLAFFGRLLGITKLATLTTAKLTAAMAKFAKVLVGKVLVGLKLLGKFFLTNPLGLFLTVLVGIIALFVVLYNKNENFRKAVQEAFQKVKDILQKVWDWIKENWPKLFAILLGPFGLVVLAIIKNWDTILDFFKNLPEKLKQLGSKLWDWIVDAFKIVVTAYILAWKAIFDFIVDLPGKLFNFGKKIWDWIVDAFKIVVTMYITAWTAIFDFIKGLPAKLLEIGKTLWNWISDRLSPIFESVKTKFGEIIEWVKGMPERFVKNVSNIWGWVSSGLSSIIENVKEKFVSLVEWFKGLPGRITSAASGLFNGIRDAFRSALNWIIEKWNSLSFTLPSITAFGKTVGGTSFRVPPIKPFAMGGIVPPSPVGTLGLLAEAGRPERVEPLDPDGLSKRDKAMIQLLAGSGGPANIINVYPSPGMNETELAAMIDRTLAFRLRRGGA